MTDPIADLLTRIRNASQAQNRYTVAPYSKIKFEILKVLHNQGFIDSFQLIKDDVRPFIKIILKYDANRNPVIRKIDRKSRPGMRRYVSKDQIPRVLGGMGISILSTSYGIMDGQEAKKKNIGGELLAFAW